ncbi:MAG: DEAD/DEAH box helicase family protein [Oscillospiraceae bacterium]|nr:DEAD/DEAH box helicase family protein [Oscillospiraceae bacterium]
MIPFKISCNTSLSFQSKPDARTTAFINNQLPKSAIEVDRSQLTQLVKMIGGEGVPFCPATFTNGKRSVNNFEQIQLISLDFDNKDPTKAISTEEAQSRTVCYQVPCLAIYDTMSSTNHNKFRMLFLNDVSITSRRSAEVMIDALYTIFPEADSSCRDVSRLFYGGKRLLYFNEDIPKINIQSTICGMTKYLEDRYGKTNYKRKVNEFIKRHHLAANNKGMPAISVVDADSTGVVDDNKNSPNPSFSIEGFGEKLLNRYYSISFTTNTSNSAPKNDKKKRNHLEYRSSVLNDVRSECQLFREFESGHRQLHHMELFGLATNLTKIEAGSKLFLDVVSKPTYSDKHSGSEYWKHNIKNYISGYKPTACGSFCSYCNECVHGTNILATLKVKHHEMVPIKDTIGQLVPLEEVSEDFIRQLKKAIQSNDLKWHIIRAQTALGKTETYIRLLKNSDKRILIVVPTNKLKQEVKDRAAALGIKLAVSPSLHELKDEISDEAWEEIQHLYDIGASVLSFVKERANKEHPEYEKAFEKYLQQLDEFMKCSGHAITTHRRLLNLDVSKYDLVIVDEDIIFSSIISNRIEIPVSKLKKLKEQLPEGNPLKQKVKMLLKRLSRRF